MIDIRYVSGTLGEVIDLSSFPYLMQSEDIFDFDWDYLSTSIPGRNGGKVTRFYREIVEIPIQVYIHAPSKEEFFQLLNHWRDVLERDIANMTPGRLYIGEQYLTCYIYASSKSMWSKNIKLNIDAAKLVSEYPFWCKDVSIEISAADFEVPPDGFLDYDFDYEYDYRQPVNIDVYNDNYTDAEFVMTMHGDCVNPGMIIGSHRYEVRTTLLEGEYLIIDSREKSVTKVDNDGRKKNIYNAQNKQYDIFAKIPVGWNTVELINVPNVKLTQIHERSEPLWNF